MIKNFLSIIMNHTFRIIRSIKIKKDFNNKDLKVDYFITITMLGKVSRNRFVKTSSKIWKSKDNFRGMYTIFRQIRIKTRISKQIL